MPEFGTAQQETFVDSIVSRGTVIQTGVAESVVARAQQLERGALTVRDTMTLAFEHLPWKYAGAKEATIRELFTESATRYYQRLNALTDRPAAEACDPQLVHRLRRLRELRRSARSARRHVVAL